MLLGGLVPLSLKERLCCRDLLCEAEVDNITYNVTDKINREETVLYSTFL